MRKTVLSTPDPSVVMQSSVWRLIVKSDALRIGVSGPLGFLHLVSKPVGFPHLVSKLGGLRKPRADFTASETHVSQLSVIETSEKDQIGLVLAISDQAGDPAIDQAGQRSQKNLAGLRRPAGAAE